MMNRSQFSFRKITATILLGTQFALGLFAQTYTPPIEYPWQENLPNFFSLRGLPISTDSNDPGSDGRAPTPEQQDAAGLTPNVPTPGQFKGFISYGGTVRPRSSVSTYPNFAIFAEDALPKAETGSGRIVLRRAQVGLPYYGRRVNFLFGSILMVPEHDTSETPLPPEILPDDYWVQEPYTDNNHADASYYWSPHAKSVFATRSGPISIQWRKALPEGTTSEITGSTSSNPDVTDVSIGGLVYQVLTKRYVVSGSPSKSPKRLYWTEEGFDKSGITIPVPEGIVTNFIYSNLFPASVTTPYEDPGASDPVPPDGGSIYKELRTTYYDQDTKTIRSFNVEGRILLELLGDTLDNGRRQFLGIEIIDVIKRPNPADITIELGEKLTAWQDPTIDDSHLVPVKLNRQGESIFTFDHYISGQRLDLYAIHKTRQLNDFLLHWTEEGLQGLQWPSRFIRYKMVWPDDIEKYSHFARSPAASEDEAKLTAVALPTENVPIIEYQDPLDRPRANLTETLGYYTWLDEQYPAHRALVRYTSGEKVAFERIFSWLTDSLTYQPDGTALASAQLQDFVARPDINGIPQPPLLSSWNVQTGRFEWNGLYFVPRIVTGTVDVGQRLEAPFGLTYQSPQGQYWAGHIRPEKGDSYQPDAYIDPLEQGFEEAVLSSIIPVNSIPGDNNLEVWWFRSNNASVQDGFKPAYWPSVIGQYTIQWPVVSPEIILASNDGSGGLDTLKSAGKIFYQNDPTLPGYNPNEEHALMIGGQAYALRDDLNITTAEDYSSDPYVLLSYTGPDSRPAMSVFRVLREKPSAGEVFDYITQAGTLLQAPMPLPLLPAPTIGEGVNEVNYNSEPPATGTDFPGNWNPGLHDVADFEYNHYKRFTYLDRKNKHWIYRGLHSGPPPLEAGTYNTITETFSSPIQAKFPHATDFGYAIHASHRPEALVLQPREGTTLPTGLRIEGLYILGQITQNTTVQLTLRSAQTEETVDLDIPIQVTFGGDWFTQSPLTINSVNPYSGTNTIFGYPFERPPYLAESPNTSNSFTMRYYYKTQEGFAFPGLTQQPAAGTIVPYLRPIDIGGNYVGEPHNANTASLDIVYRPVWPVEVPKLRIGDTLTKPKNGGLPAVRGQTSLEVLYDQGIATDVVDLKPAAVLHDSTREKSSRLTPTGLSKIPSGVRNELYLGRTYFPDLPPHLVERFFLDPNRSELGDLVLKGEFRDEVLGEDYLLLNVLRGTDLETVKALCPDGDPDKSKWDVAVEGLRTVVETFRENPSVPNDWIVDPSLNMTWDVGEIVAIDDPDSAVDSYALSATGPGSGYITMVAGGGNKATPEAEPVSLNIIKVDPVLHTGELKVITPSNPLSEQLTLQHSADLAGRFEEYKYDWRIAAPVNGLPPLVDENMSQWQLLQSGANYPRFTLGGADIRTLSDNYLVMRYKALNPNHPLYDPDESTGWSEWTNPQLAEGWIKRVLAGINPFRQRITDLFNNAVDTNVSLLTQAGPRWEGDIALNLENINEFGLIEIYETVLRRGRMLSIDNGINYGPANDALLLAAGYLNDLYMFLGNEAWADASNPTVGFGTADQNYGDVATSLFAFQGQVASVLEEELTLLRGRDDFLLPGVELSPVYNRLVWNYTRGINAGEVVYALNYNIQEKADGDPTGIIDAADAAELFPQGHGDAYGHYLMAIKNYYSLFMDPDFDWVPRIEAVQVLGQPVSVDYFDERKFAAAAAAFARTGKQVFDLSWRQQFDGNEFSGWEKFGDTRENTRTGTTRYWGMDHWATRTGIGSYVNWVVGNSILPDEDQNPNAEGIQKIDRTTVPELAELVTISESLQSALDKAEGRATPLELPVGGIAFDINPAKVTGVDPKTHFEQLYDRAVVALNNAVVAFDDAKDVTQIMRSEQDSLADLQNQIARQEFSYESDLIGLYGTPYPDDIGPGRTYKTGYGGPDMLHYMYVDLPGLQRTPGDYAIEAPPQIFRVDIQDVPGDWGNILRNNFDFHSTPGDPDYIINDTYVEYELGSHGFYGKPSTWVGKRYAPGAIQQAISEILMANDELGQALINAKNARIDLTAAISLFEARKAALSEIKEFNRSLLIAQETLDSVKLAFDLFELISERKEKTVEISAKALALALPSSFIAGLSSGGDLTSSAKAALETKGIVVGEAIAWLKIAKFIGIRSFEHSVNTSARWIEFNEIGPRLGDIERKGEVLEIAGILRELQSLVVDVEMKIQALDDAERNYRTMVADADTILLERQAFRQRSSALVQGYRTRDAAFRIFRNEKLERYKTLFDLAAQYAYMAAQAYDYETGLLGTPEGQGFLNKIVAARALGVVENGQPQFAGSTNGDPGLSSALAEMFADWTAVRGRLGFNNPDGYGTTVSLRQENFRILPGAVGDYEWQDILRKAWMPDVLADSDVRRYAMQLDDEGLPVPGIVLTFSTVIESGKNLFGLPLGPGDHSFNNSSFATKIFANGVALNGYIGMSDPATNSGTVGDSGGTSPDDPDTSWLDPNALAATPYVYLIPTGADTMRSPPLYDSSKIRTWNVHDVTVPLPFNIGASDLENNGWWQTSDFLTEDIFNIRKHQAFRPVSSPDVFSFDLYAGSTLAPSQFTNSRLIGRSVWNTEWKLVIPAKTLMNDEYEAIERFIRSVNDIYLHFITYSYSGN